MRGVKFELAFDGYDVPVGWASGTDDPSGWSPDYRAARKALEDVAAACRFPGSAEYADALDQEESAEEIPRLLRAALDRLDEGV